VQCGDKATLHGLVQLYLDVSRTTILEHTKENKRKKSNCILSESDVDCIEKEANMNGTNLHLFSPNRFSCDSSIHNSMER
jgi:hypothetical protein